jgi:hypothetical protein
MPIRMLDDGGIEMVLLDVTGMPPDEALDLAREVEKEVRASPRRKRFRLVYRGATFTANKKPIGDLYQAEWLEAHNAALGGWR